MAGKKTERIRKTTQKIADIIEVHLSKLAPSQREARWRAFEKVTLGGGVRRAKGGGRSRTQATPLVARGRARS